MLKFRESLYFGESVKSEHRKLMRRLSRGRRLNGKHVLITYAFNETDLFDLIPVWELHFPYRKKQDFFVLGLATDKEEALEVVSQMVTEVYEATGAFDVRAYFGYQTADWR